MMIRSSCQSLQPRGHNPREEICAAVGQQPARLFLDSLLSQCVLLHKYSRFPL